MNNFASNCLFITNEVQFISDCDRTSADLLDSYNMDRRISLEAYDGASFSAKLKRVFLGK
ncbi:MAG: hypothetical protein K2O18_00090 [Oscillospiraceae bacterium]|nr:hypothetical protein [Oscillospiraceae bacterium]